MPSNSFNLPNRICVKKSAQCHLRREDALRYLGYQEHQNPDKGIMHRFEHLAKQCEQDNSVQFTWRIFEIDAEASQWDAAGHAAFVAFKDSPLILPGKGITYHLKGALYAACMACTLGFSNERELKRINSINATDGVMYNACASALIEAGANATQANIEQAILPSGLQAGLRYSPGYGDLPLSVQRDFIKALDATKTIGLSLTPTFLMIPTKSITAICGLFPFEPPKDYTSPCSTCSTRKGCTYLAKGMTCYDSNV